MKGQAVQIVRLEEEDNEHSFSLDEDALKTVLCQKEIKNKPVCIVSVAGAFRKGKSFLLNFMLRFLECEGSEDWLKTGDDGEDDLEGFHWCGGSQRDTTGILMWSEVLTVHTPAGEVAVVLMDTQGCFDKQSTVKDVVTIFALSLMTSSVLIYNLDDNIQEDDFQHLNFFTEYGRLALDEEGEAPFQKLLMLVRDWQYPYEQPFGAEGGKQLLQFQMEVDDEHEEIQKRRSSLKSCFSEMSCFLLPHPGRNVATNPHFTGHLKDIDPEFLEHLEAFVPTVLAPEALKVKKAGGKAVRCKDMVQYFKSYMEILKGDDMPEPKSMLEVTIQANNLVSLASALELYMDTMEEFCGGDKPYLNEQDVEVEHLRVVDLAMQEFDSRRKMGGEEYSQEYREKLNNEIEEAYNQFKANNEAKNVFKAANAPITLFLIWGVLYIVAQVAALLMLYPVITVTNWLMWLLFAIGVTWGYVKYSGNFPNIGVKIEEVTAVVWEKAVQPILTKIAERTAQEAVDKFSSKMN